MKKYLLAVFFASCTFSYAADVSEPIPSQATVCSACHGEKGVSVNPQWPNLAGQHALYLQKQLSDIQAGKTRDVPTMAGILNGLNEQDFKILANYYASQKRPEGTTPEKFLKRGEQLYRGGDFNQQITACIGCHGPKGTGNAQANFPVLSGQHADYIVLQLQAFKEGKRSNDLNAIMRDISRRMSPEDMQAVAYYIQGLY